MLNGNKFQSRTRQRISHCNLQMVSAYVKGFSSYRVNREEAGEGGWMDGRTDGRTDGQEASQPARQTTDRQQDERTEAHTDGQKD